MPTVGNIKSYELYFYRIRRRSAQVFLSSLLLKQTMIFSGPEYLSRNTLSLLCFALFKSSFGAAQHIGSTFFD